MESPAILRTHGRVGVPELRLEKLAAWIDEAAAIRSDGTVVAGEGAVARTAGCIGKGRVGVCDGSVAGAGSLALDGDLREEPASKGEQGAEGEGVGVGRHVCWQD